MNIISKSEIDGSICLDLKHHGVKCNAAFLMMKIENTNAFLKKHHMRVNQIISKIYSIFHAQGIIYQGDIYTGKNMIIWKEDRDNAVSRFKLYVYKLRKNFN